MGRDISYHVFKKPIQHTKDKGILCLKLEKYTGKEELYFHIVNTEIDNKGYYDGNPKETLRDRINDNKLCPACYLFTTKSEFYRGYELNPLIIKSAEQRHSYSNPYWESKHYDVLYNIGTISHLFRSWDIREIEQEEVEHKLEKLEELKYHGDYEHYQETYDILMFLKYWCTDDNLVFIFDEI